MTDCNEWKKEKRHECANLGKVKQLELWWQLYITSLLDGTYKISGSLIFVEQSVHQLLLSSPHMAWELGPNNGYGPLP
jgi:hypothetical protein